MQPHSLGVLRHATTMRAWTVAAVLSVLHAAAGAAHNTSTAAIANRARELFPHSAQPTAGQTAAAAIAECCAGNTDAILHIRPAKCGAADLLWPVDHNGTRAIDWIWECRASGLRPLIAALVPILSAEQYGWPDAPRVSQMVIDRRQMDVLPAWSDVPGALSGALIARALLEQSDAVPHILSVSRPSDLRSALSYPIGAVAIKAGKAHFATRRTFEDAWIAAMADRTALEAALYRAKTRPEPWDPRRVVAALVKADEKEAIEVLAGLGSDGHLSFGEALLVVGADHYPQPGARSALSTSCTALDTVNLERSGAGLALAALLIRTSGMLPPEIANHLPASGYAAAVIAQLEAAHFAFSPPCSSPAALFCTARTFALYPSWPRSSPPDHCILDN